MCSPEPRESSTHGDQQDSRGVVAVQAEIDISTCGELWDRIDVEIARVNVVVLDLSETTFIDSSGLSVVVRAKRKLEGVGGSLVLRNPRPPVARVLALTGLDKVITIEAAPAADG